MLFNVFEQCLGGQGTWREFLTLPNIIKVFNPKLIGYAYGDSLAEDRYSQFNVAEIGALSKDLPFMTKELVKRITMDKRININEDWKVQQDEYVFTVVKIVSINNNNKNYYFYFCQ